MCSATDLHLTDLLLLLLLVVVVVVLPVLLVQVLLLLLLVSLLPGASSLACQLLAPRVCGQRRCCPCICWRDVLIRAIMVAAASADAAAFIPQVNVARPQLLSKQVQAAGRYSSHGWWQIC